MAVYFLTILFILIGYAYRIRIIAVQPAYKRLQLAQRVRRCRIDILLLCYGLGRAAVLVRRTFPIYAAQLDRTPAPDDFETPIPQIYAPMFGFVQ